MIWALVIGLIIIGATKVVVATIREEREKMNARAKLASQAKTIGMGGSPGKPSPRPVYGKAIFANAGGPETFEDYVGQTRAKAIVKMAAASAQMRQTRLPHTLIATGLHGVGKSAIARVIANFLNVGITEVQGELSGQEALGILANMKNGDILFIDEAHKLADKSKRAAEWLLPLLQDGVLMTAAGPKNVPDVTVILATTDKDILPETILSRLPLKPVLEAYTTTEATSIAAGMAKKIFAGTELTLNEDTFEAIAVAANDTPREIAGLLAQVRDALLVGLLHVEDGGFVNIEPLLDLLDRTMDGLDSVAIDMLLTLMKAGGKAGMNNLATNMGTPTVAHHTEKLLVSKGFMVIGSGIGRSLTEEGMERAKELADKYAPAE